MGFHLKEKEILSNEEYIPLLIYLFKKRNLKNSIVSVIPIRVRQRDVPARWRLSDSASANTKPHRKSHQSSITLIEIRFFVNFVRNFVHIQAFQHTPIASRTAGYGFEAIKYRHQVRRYLLNLCLISTVKGPMFNFSQL